MEWMNEKAFFYLPFFFSKKIEWMNDVWAFPWKRKKNKKTHKKLKKKIQATFIKKKETSSKSDWMTDELFLGKKKTAVIFFPLRGKKKYTIFGFEWMNDQRPCPRKKKYVTFEQVVFLE